MLTGISTVYSVIAIGINLHIKLFSELYQLLGILCTILEMNVVICHTVYEQQVAMQFVGTGKSG